MLVRSDSRANKRRKSDGVDPNSRSFKSLRQLMWTTVTLCPCPRVRRKPSASLLLCKWNHPNGMSIAPTDRPLVSLCLGRHRFGVCEEVTGSRMRNWPLHHSVLVSTRVFHWIFLLLKYHTSKTRKNHKVVKARNESNNERSNYSFPLTISIVAKVLISFYFFFIPK